VIRGSAPLLAIAAIIATIAAGGCTRAAEPPPPDGLGRPIDEFGQALASQLDQAVGTEVRFVGFEQREHDQLLFLFFELRQWPHLGPATLAYLVSRCTAHANLEPLGMGGGVVVGGDLATDPELEYLRSAAQPPCPAAGR
jgi:hypothetical protein